MLEDAGAALAWLYACAMVRRPVWRSMRRVLAVVATVATSFVAGAASDSALAYRAAHGPERAVAALPGVGAGWLDTLRRVAGDATVDTLTELQKWEYGPGLLGEFEPDHMTVSVNADVIQYFRDIRSMAAAGEGFGYMHPLTTANPAAVAAHEFGHRFQFALWPHGGVREAGDSLPTYAQDDNERFADRFSRAMLALRGWDDPDPRDAMLNHVVSIRLRLSYAKED